MRVLYFHQHFSTPKGAVGTRSYEMAQRLIARGHQVTVVCGSYSGGQTGLSSDFVSGKRTGMVAGIRVIELDLAYSNNHGLFKRTISFMKFAIRSIGIALTEKYDLVFATTTPLTAGIPGICARWFRNKPFIFEVRDLWPELPKAMGVIRNPLILGALSALEWISYRSAHRLIGLSPGIVEGISHRGVLREKIAMVPNGCDLDIFNIPTDPWLPEGVSESQLVAVFTGTHGVANKLDAVLDTALELKSRGRDDIRLILVGQGKLKPALVERARALNLDNVVFHDPVNKARLSGLMASADIGLQILANVPAFYYGTSPNKFFDYIASGLPVLNNYPGWLADLIKTNDCGYVVPPENPKAFADALEHAADDREGLKLKGLKGRELAINHFDRRILADQFVDWLEGAVR
jgi:glycosyltransferase involved in cell wall biosynthesis